MLERGTREYGSTEYDILLMGGRLGNSSRSITQHGRGGKKIAMAKIKHPVQDVDDAQHSKSVQVSEIRSIYDRGSASSVKSHSGEVTDGKRGAFTPAGNYSIEEFPALKQLFDAYER